MTQPSAIFQYFQYNCRTSLRKCPILFGCCQTMTLLVVTRCYDSCLSPTLCRQMHVSFSPHQLASQEWQRSVAHGRNCQGTMPWATGAMWRTAVRCRSSWGQAYSEVAGRSGDGRYVVPVEQVGSVDPDCQLLSV